jgi:hypothetical protein
MRPYLRRCRVSEILRPFTLSPSCAIGRGHRTPTLDLHAHDLLVRLNGFIAHLREQAE